LIEIKGNILRRYSILRGLEIPDGEGDCGCKVEAPALHELELMSRPHRWPEMRDVQRDYFNALLDKVTKFEVEMLRLLKLPDIDTVRGATDEDEDEATGTFIYTAEMQKGLRKIFKEWKEELLGTDNIKRTETNEAVYPFYTLTAYSVGLNKTAQQTVRALPEFVDPKEVLANRPLPNLTNQAIARIYKQGNKRVIEKLNQNFTLLNRDILRELTGDAHPLKVARLLHRSVGEGNAWWWLRFARSESALAANAAFMDSAQAYQVPYQRWSAAPNACPICQQFTGNVWPVGSGPEPVEDSHPNCLCVLVPVYVTPKPIQDTWDRPTPYDQPYEEAEIFGGLDSQLRGLNKEHATVKCGCGHC